MNFIAKLVQGKLEKLREQETEQLIDYINGVRVQTAMHSELIQIDTNSMVKHGKPQIYKCGMRVYNGGAWRKF